MTEDPLDPILEYIKHHPGATPADIRKGVPGCERGFYGSHTNVVHALRVLRLRGVIENRGPTKPGQGPGQYHAVEGPTASRYLQRKGEELPLFPYHDELLTNPS